MRTFHDRQLERWAFIDRTDAANTKLAIFVHGFRGGYLSTWGALPDMLRVNADGSVPFSQWDYTFLGYSTFDVETYLDIAALLSTQLRSALNGDPPYAHPYSQFSLIGHSLGTLGIRQLICAQALSRDTALFQAIRSVTLFGPPNEGSVLARLPTFYSVRAALRPNNPQLRMLKDWTACAWTIKKWPTPQLVMGMRDWVVGSKQAWFNQWYGDSKKRETFTNFDHRQLVKPVAWPQSQVVDVLSAALR